MTCHNIRYRLKTHVQKKDESLCNIRNQKGKKVKHEAQSLFLKREVHSVAALELSLISHGLHSLFFSPADERSRMNF